MNKILLSIGILVASLTASAQTVTNGNFESAFAPVSGYSIYLTSGWKGYYQTPETSAPYAGAQSLKLQPFVDAALNSYVNWGNDTITSYAYQKMDGDFSNVDFNNLTGSFMMKYNKGLSTDTGYVMIAVYDTLTAGSNDNKLLYADAYELTTSISTWTTVNFGLNQINTGNYSANEIVIFFLSTYTGYYDYNTPSTSTALYVDNFTWNLGYLGVEQAEAASAVVYPNPVNDVLNVKFNSEISSVSVIGMDGKVISTTSANGVYTTVNVSDLKAGVYFYEVTGSNGSVVRNSFVKL